MTKKIRLTNKMRDVLLDKAVSIAIEPEIAKAKALTDKVDARLLAEVIKLFPPADMKVLAKYRVVQTYPDGSTMHHARVKTDERGVFSWHIPVPNGHGEVNIPYNANFVIDAEPFKALIHDAIDANVAKTQAEWAFRESMSRLIHASVTFEDVLTFWADADKYRGLIVPDDKPGTALAVNMAEDVSVVMARLAKRT
jgi:hypothetical protein